VLVSDLMKISKKKKTNISKKLDKVIDILKRIRKDLEVPVQTTKKLTQSLN